MKFTPHYSVSFGCFSSVLSKILCFGTYSTHSTNPTGSDIEKQSVDEIEKIVDGSIVSNVNIVTKLMGLDSILDIDFKPSQTSIERRNSMDHRRRKTAILFRERVGYFDIEDDDFLVLDFEKKRRGKCGRKQGRKNRAECNEDDKGILVISGEFKEERNEGKSRKKKKKIKGCLVESKESEIDCGCECENLSPVSILDHGEFDNDDVEVIISEEDSKKRKSNSKGTKWRQEELLQDDESGGNSIEQVEQREMDNRNEGKEIGVLKRKDYRKHENLQMVTRICRLAGADILNNYNNDNFYYFDNNNNNNNNLKLSDRRMSSIQELEDIGRDLGQLIFDELVSELVICIF